MTEPFVPFTTERLTVRAFRPDDAAIVHEYRNDADVARYQDWPLPVTIERVRTAIERDQEVGHRPVAGEGWQLAVDLGGQLIGDVYLGLDEHGAVATLGYTFARAHQGKGYAAEAVAAVVDRLLAMRPVVHRIQASTDPENLPSIRLLESLGFTGEGLARRSEPIRGEWLDDARFGLLREDRAAWLARPTMPPAVVRLVEITPDNAGDVLRLKTFDWQQRLVAPNLSSFADALVPEVIDGLAVVPWYRAIEADGELVGFVMLAEPTAAHPHPYLWRLMIDRRHQRRGAGRLALAAAIDQARAWGGEVLEVSWMPGFGSPEPFYLRNGFAPTGEMDGDEIVARLTLTRDPLASP